VPKCPAVRTAVRTAGFVYDGLMNALWITRLCAYKNSPLSLETAKKIIDVKITRQNTLLKKYHRAVIQTNIHRKNSLGEILLEEARVAKSFWKEFKRLLPAYCDFLGRKPRSSDIANKLLDIGYHHLMNVVMGILNKYKVPSDIALFHVARNSDSKPLIYDLVEMFRSDIVEAEVLRFLRLKKKKLIKIEKEIPHFLHEVNKRLEKKYYLKDFRMCHTYRYYMEVQVLKFIKAVNKRQIFESMGLPARHDNRCLTGTIAHASLETEA
jgi:CRISPR-associated endonuclease Cas1